MIRFNRDHYDVIAKLLKETKPKKIKDDGDYFAKQQWETTVTEFAHWFEINSPSFNKTRFLISCGWGEK